jgi:hypothetical protein
VGSKIWPNCGWLGQINAVNFLGYIMISPEGEHALNVKILNFVRILGVINQDFRCLFLGI